ncbi:MAG: response regulator [Deltaproteobacteria bacterium]|jgi:CheY-like chemotaxis protein|nr:response regulator [Deltaproteobacteria bacterium]
MRDVVHPTAPPAQQEKQSARRTGERRARVLIAEDDWAFRDVLLLTFEGKGYEVVAVGSGTDMLRAIGSSMLPRSGVRQFDLIVSDLRMPGWNGLVGLEKLASNPLLPPIVLITAFGTDGVRQRAKRAGAVAVLDKPFDLDELTALADTLVAQPHEPR